METQFFTANQQFQLIGEENAELKKRLEVTEKKLKEQQMKVAKKERSGVLTQQLQLKEKEISAYQKEVQNQKAENLKLRERMKELVQRRAAPV